PWVQGHAPSRERRVPLGQPQNSSSRRVAANCSWLQLRRLRRDSRGRGRSYRQLEGSVGTSATVHASPAPEFQVAQRSTVRFRYSMRASQQVLQNAWSAFQSCAPYLNQWNISIYLQA